jgi:hypothetical protein
LHEDQGVNLHALKAGIVSFLAAIVASLCCLLPLGVVLLGLDSGSFVLVTAQYRAIFVPMGIVGVALGYMFYFREKRRCNSLGCAIAGRKTNLTLLIFATIIVSLAAGLDFLPELVLKILQGVV